MHKGHFKPQHPAHEDHMKHFEEALKDALEEWSGPEKTVSVTLEATVSPNPGGIKEYFVTLGG
jgi:hypothetical protein